MTTYAERVLAEFASLVGKRLVMVQTNDISDPTELILTFADGSKMTVTLGSPWNEPRLLDIEIEAGERE